MPLSRDEQARRRQLANLQRGRAGARPPAPPAQNVRALRHGAYSEALLRDVSEEVVELIDALGDAAPVREPDGGLPAADVVAVERAARALKRYRHLAGWFDLHGRLTDDGEVKPAAELELKAERELAAALADLGMNPAARAKLGVDLARAKRTSLEDFIEADAAEIDHDQEV